MRPVLGSLAFVGGDLVANEHLSIYTGREERYRTLGRVVASGQLFRVFWPHEGPDPDALDLLIVHNTFPEFVGQGINPLEPSFLEAGLLGFFSVVSDTPDDTGHLGDFVYATSKSDGDDLFYGP